MLTFSVPVGSSSIRRTPRHRGLQRGERAVHLAQEPLAAFGQRQATRAAMEQAHAEVGLEPRHVLADARRRQPEDAGRGGEAAVLRGPDERHQMLHLRHRPILNRGLKLIAACAGWSARGDMRTLRLRPANPRRQPDGKTFMRALAHALFASLLALALPAASSAQGFDVPRLRQARDRDQRRHDPRPLRRHGPGGRAAARLRRDRRHVGAAGRGSGARPHGDRSRSARPRACRPSPPAASTRRPRPKTSAGVLVALGVRAGRRRRPRHRQHGRVPVRRAHPERVRRLVLIDAPVPGVGPWEEILKNPLLWHFRFGGPDMERLVAGRERIYLDRFWNEFSADAGALQRSRARPLREAVRAARRDAFRLRAVRRVRPGRDRQPRVPRRQRPTEDADPRRSAARSRSGR